LAAASRWSIYLDIRKGKKEKREGKKGREAKPAVTSDKV
jgi:hypothetical protein